MKLEHIPPDQLEPFERNPRINDHAVDAVIRSIQEFGFNCPIVAGPDNRICAGHTRWKAAKKLGMQTVPVLRVDSLKAEKFIAFNITDNQTASLASWKDELLTELVVDLSESNFDLTSLGFPTSQLEALLVPEIDINWDALDNCTEKNISRNHVYLPVKIPVEKQDIIKKALRSKLKIEGIKDSDIGIATGILFGRFLGVL